MHWNANSLPTLNFLRIPYIQAYNAVHDCHIIAISESKLNAQHSDDDINIPGYNPIRCDLRENIGHTHGGVLVYHKLDIAAAQKTDIDPPSYTIVLDLKIYGKKVFFIHSYRRFGMNGDVNECNTYFEKFENMMEKLKQENPYCTIVVGDFNAHHSTWHKEHPNLRANTDVHGVRMQSIFADNNLEQIVNQPTYVMNNQSTLIDLVATDQPNLVLQNEVLPSPDPLCHHRVNLVRMNLKCTVPDPTTRYVFHYPRADEESLQRSLYQFDWHTFLEGKHPDEKLDLVSESIMNAAKNYIPGENKTFYPKDPPWLTHTSKNLYNKYRRKFKGYIRRGSPLTEKPYIDSLKQDFAETVKKEKENYMKNLGAQVSDPRTGQKKYWTVLKKLMNKKVATIIPPVLVEGRFITDIKEKCDCFNQYFKNQCTLVETTSTLPPLARTTNLSLSEVNFNENDIIVHIKKLNINKAHGHDGIPARVIKLCGGSIALPLYIIYKDCITRGYFPDKWKKANVVPIYKKKEKNLIQNYRPVSLLPIFGKIFEKLIFDKLYLYIFSNNFIDDRQSGYRHGDSTVKQLLSITHEIYKAFDANKELRAVFLDISRAFDKVWAEGLIFKLKRIGIEGDMLNILTSFLANRKQRVTMDGTCSDWADVKAGVPQGSILGPILFLVYINDLFEVVTSDIRIFADDTFIFRVVDPCSTEDLNKDLRNITAWAHQWKKLFNPDMTKQAVEVVFSKKVEPTKFDQLNFNGIPSKQEDETKHIGLMLDRKLNYESHLQEKLAKARQGLGVMMHLKKWVAHPVLETIYKLYVRPHLDYADVVYHTASPANERTPIFRQETNIDILKEVEKIQYKAARVVTGAWYGTKRSKLYENLGWESLEDRRTMRKLCILHETIENKFPRYLSAIVDEHQHTSERVRSTRTLIPYPSNRCLGQSFFPSTISDWNNLRLEERMVRSRSKFKRILLNKIRPKRHSYYGLMNNDKVKYLTMLRMGLSPLKGHKYNHEFTEELRTGPNCVVCNIPETTEHYLLYCRSYRLSRSILFEKVSEIMNIDFSTLARIHKKNILLYGKSDLTNEENFKILTVTTEFIEQSKRLSTF